MLEKQSAKCRTNTEGKTNKCDWIFFSETAKDDDGKFSKLYAKNKRY
jgi:hypothetical protein